MNFDFFEKTAARYTRGCRIGLCRITPALSCSACYFYAFLCATSRMFFFFFLRSERVFMALTLPRCDVLRLVFSIYPRKPFV
jgi:hypothetical protein